MKRREFLGWPVSGWILAFVAWTVLATLSACQAALAFSQGGMPVRWSRLLTGSFVDWYTCALFTPGYLWLARRYPFDRQRWPVSAIIHLVATSAFVVAKYAIYVPVRNWLDTGDAVWRFESMLARSFIVESIAFWATAAAIHAIEYQRRYRERATHALRLEAQLVEARLEALSAQLHPHFLFNTLHGISTLMHRDVEAADTMLTRLSDLLRRALRNADRHEVPIAEELETLDLYLAIMGTRFHDRLTVTKIVEPAAANALVPPFILQPLVENALQHGIARRPGAGRVEIGVRRSGDSVNLEVRDDGPGLPRGNPAFPREGVGLTNTRLRLAELYGDHQRLELREVDVGGLVVSLTIPYRQAAPAPAREVA
jgi:two-component system, LytTR family, sensor kinase